MLQPGQQVGGKYLLEEEIGRGAMGAVWRARHLTLESLVAIKVLDSTDPKDEESIAGFLREARVAAAVRHRHVVQIMDFGLTDEGFAYLVMEYLEGESLADYLSEHAPLPAAPVVRIVSQVLRGLEAVHERGVVHRDVKPGNIFLVREKHGIYPKLLDFGISRALAGNLSSPVPTRIGAVVGTFPFMSPEQAQGAPDLDARSDLYSMGVVLFEALTDRLPFDRPSNMATILAILNDPAPPILSLRPDLDPALAAVVDRALAKDRAARFQTADEMRSALVAASRETVPADGPLAPMDTVIDYGLLGAQATTSKGPSSRPPSPTVGLLPTEPDARVLAVPAPDAPLAEQVTVPLIVVPPVARDSSDAVTNPSITISPTLPRAKRGAWERVALLRTQVVRGIDLGIARARRAPRTVVLVAAIALIFVGLLWLLAASGGRDAPPRAGAPEGPAPDDPLPSGDGPDADGGERRAATPDPPTGPDAALAVDAAADGAATDRARPSRPRGRKIRVVRVSDL